MDKYLCKECNQYIDISNKETHDMYCLNSLKQSEYDSLIPCELCNEFIDFDSYSDHIRECRRAPMSNDDFMNFLNILPNYINRQPGLSNITGNSRETPEVNTGETPDENTGEPPDENTGETPDENTGETPDENTGETPDENIGEPPDGNDDNNPDLLNPESLLELLVNTFNSTNDDNFSLLFSPLQTNYNIPLNIPLNNLESNMDNYETLTNLVNEVGNVNVGLDDINKYTEIKSEKMKCPICSQDTEFIRETSCKHKFCMSCINEWCKEHKNCPICMQELQKI